MPPTALHVQDSDQIVPATTRKVFVAVDADGNRIGETHPGARFTDHEIDLIRELSEKDGLSYAVLAEKFECPRSTIQMICQYKRRASTISSWRVVLLHTPATTKGTP